MTTVATGSPFRRRRRGAAHRRVRYLTDEDIEVIGVGCADQPKPTEGSGRKK